MKFIRLEVTERQTLTTRDGSDSMLKTKLPIFFCLESWTELDEVDLTEVFIRPPCCEVVTVFHRRLRRAERDGDQVVHTCLCFGPGVL